jgi:hypothetical protein
VVSQFAVVDSRVMPTDFFRPEDELVAVIDQRRLNQIAPYRAA